MRRLRPDMVVRLPSDRAVIVVAKAPLTSYLDASTTTDERERARLLRAHAAGLRGHVDALTARRFRELGPAGERTEIQPLTPVGARARGVQAPELALSANAPTFETSEPGIDR